MHADQANGSNGCGMISMILLERKTIFASSGWAFAAMAAPAVVPSRSQGMSLLN
jgi:hypothetical protein